MTTREELDQLKRENKKLREKINEIILALRAGNSIMSVIKPLSIVNSNHSRLKRK